MNSLKNWGVALGTLLIMLILLQFVLKMAKKLPIIDGIAEKGQELAFEN